MAFLNMAEEYHHAAEELFRDYAPRASGIGSRPTASPTYLLYFHSMELAFKAYLSAVGHPAPKIHNLPELYERCRALGFDIGGDDRLALGNVASLLESGNRHQGFRYFNPNSTSQPDLAWAREIVGTLLRKVSEELVARDPDARRPSPAIKLIMIHGKPVPKSPPKDRA
jgi:hypothetical protein